MEKGTITYIEPLSKAQYAVYSCICYFDIFSHPVTSNEIRNFSALLLDQTEVDGALSELCKKQLILFFEGYYFLETEKCGNIKKRVAAEKNFYEKRHVIKRYARFIAKFPFVKSVAISGSCSKGLLDDDGDVDYFIITSPNRLWLCRTILVGFKKLILFNSKKYFCVNYFLSSDNLEIPDRNLFVACEISTLMPVNNKALFEEFLEKNKWVEEYLPNRTEYNKHFLVASEPKKQVSRVAEWLLGKGFGNMLDRLLFRFTLAVWEKKFPAFAKEEFDLNLRSRKNVSKHHPRGFQKKVLNELENRLEPLQKFGY